MTATKKRPSGAITSLVKPVTRRIRDRRLIVRITTDGVSFRGHHKRQWLSVSWEQVASLSMEQDSLLRILEQNSGEAVLKRLTAATLSAIKKVNKHGQQSTSATTGRRTNSTSIGATSQQEDKT